MSDNKKQYRYEIWENLGRYHHHRLTIASGEIDDPFLSSVIRPHGWRAALAVLLGRAEWSVRVDGTKAAFRVVFGGDYTPDPHGPPVVMGVEEAAEQPAAPE